MAYSIRCASFDDMASIADLNLRCLPENYYTKYYAYIAITHPKLSNISVDAAGNPNGYQLGKTEINATTKQMMGHTISLGVTRAARNGSLARMLMEKSNATYCKNRDVVGSTLQVRYNNVPAMHLYKDILKYTQIGVEKSYYEDGVDACILQLNLRPSKSPGNHEQKKGNKKKGKR